MLFGLVERVFMLGVNTDRLESSKNLGEQEYEHICISPAISGGNSFTRGTELADTRLLTTP